MSAAWREIVQTCLLLMWLIFVAPFTLAAEVVAPQVGIDSQRAWRAIRAVENWDGRSVGRSGEVGPGQWLPGTWRMFSERPLSWAIGKSIECRTEQERVGVKEVEWIRARLPKLGLGDSVWAIGLVHNAGYGHVAAGLVETRHRAFADRVRAVYEAEGLH